jgi:putative SOS response-associated peptidase YedK
MCGRYVLEGPVSRVQQFFDAKLTEAFEDYQSGRYNIAPTMQIPVVRINRDGERVLIRHRWGLIPSWSKDASIGAKLNNARGETVHEKPSFRTGFKRYRCLIPASGYYEWQAPPEGRKARKQPFYISPTDAPFFAMAGVCDHWTDKATGELIMSAAIITTTPCPQLAHIHDRMPVMIQPQEWEEWLNPKNQNVEALKRMIRSDEALQSWPVNFAVSGVGKNREDSSKLISPHENQK